MSKLPLGSRITPSYIRRIRHLITSMRAEMLSEISFSARIFMTMDDPIPALKQRLAQAILEEIGERNMWIAGRILGLDQPEMWNLEHGRLRRFSVHKLIRLLARINRQVEITVVAVGPLADASRPDGIGGRRKGTRIKHTNQQTCVEHSRV